MLLAVDIGNTNITIGVYDGLSLEFTARTATDSDRTGDQYAVELMGMFALNKCETASIDGAILSSVAPAVTNAMCSAVSKVVGIRRSLARIFCALRSPRSINTRCRTPSAI